MKGWSFRSFVDPPGMASPDPGMRAQAVEHFKRMVEVAVALGARLVDTVSPTPFDLPVPRITDKHLHQDWGMGSRSRSELAAELGRLCAGDAALLHDL